MDGSVAAVAIAVALGAVLLLGRARDGWRGPAAHARGGAARATGGGAGPRAPRLRSAVAAAILVAGMAVAIAIEVAAALAGGA